MTTAATLPGFIRSATAGGLPLAQSFATGAGVRLTGSTSGTVDLFPPATVTTPYTLTLPAALGASDKIIQVSSTGVLSLVDPVSPSGTGTEIQYRNGSAFGAVAGSSFAGGLLTLPLTSIVSTTANQLTVGYDATYKVALNVSSAGVLMLAGFKPSGSNVAAGAAYLDVPVSTGNATPGSWVVRSTVAGTSGSTAQTLSDTLTVGNAMVVVGGTTPKLWVWSGNDATSEIGLIENPSNSVGTGCRLRWIGASNRFALVTVDTGGAEQEGLSVLRHGNIGIYTTAPDKRLEINSATGDCLRLTYNDANGSAANYVDFAVTSAGGLTVTPSAGIVLLPTTTQLQFRDTGLYLFSQADGYLNIVSDTATRLGDATPTNYTQFDSTGHQTMVGTAKPWEDLRVEPTARTTGANAPTFEKWLDDLAGTSRGVYLYSFDDAAGGSEKEVFFTMQMPHEWDGGPISMHVHWIGDVDDTTADPRWGLEYAWKDIGEVFGDTAIVYSDGTHVTTAGADANVTAKKHYITKLGDITPGTSADGLSSVLIGRLFRDSANGADTYNAAGAKCGLLYIDAHYQKNSLGSTDEYTK